MFGLGLKSKIKRALDEVSYFYSNHFARRTERINCIYGEPSDMCLPDRIMLYALVRGLRPSGAIEIGVRWGNSARIITSAMEENGEGQLIGIDPITTNFRAGPLYGRYTLIEGYSPDAIPLAVSSLNGAPIDFVFIDAMHIHDAVLADLRGVIPFLSSGAHVLLHDTYHQGIDAAVNTVLGEAPLVDCGFITRHPSLGSPVSYGGMRLLRNGEVVSKHLISTAYKREGEDVPPFNPDVWNWDPYHKRIRVNGLDTHQ